MNNRILELKDIDRDGIEAADSPLSETITSTIKCATIKCKNTFIKRGNRHEFCDECQEKKHGPGYKKRIKNRPNKKNWQKPNICAEDDCDTVFVPEDPKQKYCPEHRTGSAISRRYKNKKTKGLAKRKEVDIDKMINELVPKSNRKNIYKIVAELVLKNPQVNYSQIIKKHPLKMSDAMFYQFRKNVNNYLDVAKNLRSEVERRTYTRKKGIYTTVYEREVNGSLSQEAKDLLLDFIETLNSNRMAKFELIEITYPTPVIEVREIK